MLLRIVKVPALSDTLGRNTDVFCASKQCARQPFCCVAPDRKEVVEAKLAHGAESKPPLPTGRKAGHLFPPSAKPKKGERFIHCCCFRSVPLCAVVSQGSDTSVYLRQYKADGTVFWNHVFVAALRNSEDKIINYVGIQHPLDKVCVQQWVLCFSVWSFVESFVLGGRRPALNTHLTGAIG